MSLRLSEMNMQYQVPADLSPYTPRKLTGSNRAGIKYKSYKPEDFAAAMQAVQEQNMSLRKASMAFNVPKTTLAEKLGDSCPKLPPLTAKQGNKKVGTRYTWTEAEMTQAIEAVQQGTVVSEAARQFGVPPSNLNSRVRGRQPKELKGDIARLTLNQEKLLVEWATAQCALGFPPSKNQIYDLANKVLQKSGSGKSLGKQWVGHWLRRHPHINAADWEPKTKWEKKTSKSFTNGSFTVVKGAEEEALMHTEGESMMAESGEVMGEALEGEGEVMSMVDGSSENILDDPGSYSHMSGEHIVSVAAHTVGVGDIDPELRRIADEASTVV